MTRERVPQSWVTRYLGTEKDFLKYLLGTNNNIEFIPKIFAPAGNQSAVFVRDRSKMVVEII